MRPRTPHDGQPYYCALCGCGFGEFIACEMPDCEFETLEAATARAAGRALLSPRGNDEHR